MKTEVIPNREPLILLRNVSYPTFQLHAVAGKGRGSPPEDVFKIVILETMKWLRQRFRDFETPETLKLPEPEAYETFSLASLKSFYLDMGYKLQIEWLEDTGIWTLRLTEPDLGASPGVEDQIRKPVPGRLFETNISYNRIADGVECGFKTVVHEPKGTDTHCEVFRLAIVKYLARHPKVGLWQTWPLVDKAHELSDSAEIKRFKYGLSDANRMMPAIVFSEYHPVPDEKTACSLDLTDEPIFNSERAIERKLGLSEFSQIPDTVTTFDDMPLSRYKMAYAQFFTLPASMREEYIEVVGQPFENGDIRIFEPAAFGAKTTVIPYQRWSCEQQIVLNELDTLVQNYPMRKSMSFGNCVFVPEAQEREREAIIRLHRSKEEMATAFQRQKKEIDTRNNASLAELAERIDDKDKVISRLNKEMEKLNKENSSLLGRVENAGCRNCAKLALKKAQIEHLKLRQTHPKRPSDLAAWAEQNFTGKLIFHDRAKGLMERVQPNEVDLALLCDALEFLATEYRDEVIGNIDQTERDSFCSEKYGRPFIVTSTMSTSVEMYPSDYKIKYYTGFFGKPVESPLNYHLKVGNDSENLLRIYFLYDKEKELIVVGSLPKHLRTRSYQ